MPKYIKVRCSLCKLPFEKSSQRYNEAIKKGSKLFCSSKCRITDRTTSKDLTCDLCGKKFVRQKYAIRDGHNFCSQSCSARYTNKGRAMKESTKIKISSRLSGVKRTEEQKKQTQQRIMLSGHFSGKLFTGIRISNCVVCGKLFCSRAAEKRKTCSKDCKTISSTKLRTYQNGSRKAVWFFNPFQNKKVLLESSWEVKTAEMLCAYNIEWTRPEPMSWIDINNKRHLYFPDFYLPKYDTYLDPKNPFCMNRDKEKLAYFKNRINLIYGDMTIINQYIENITRSDRTRTCISR